MVSYKFAFELLKYLTSGRPLFACGVVDGDGGGGGGRSSSGKLTPRNSFTSGVIGTFRRLSGRSTTSIASDAHQSPSQQQVQNYRNADAPLSASISPSIPNHSTNRRCVDAGDGTQRTVPTRHGSMADDDASIEDDGINVTAMSSSLAAAAAGMPSESPVLSAAFSYADDAELLPMNHRDDDTKADGEDEKPAASYAKDDEKPSLSVHELQDCMDTLHANVQREVAPALNQHFGINLNVPDWVNRATIEEIPPLYTVPYSDVERADENFDDYMELDGLWGEVEEQITATRDACDEFKEGSGEYHAARADLRIKSKSLEKACNEVGVTGVWENKASNVSRGGYVQGDVFVPDVYGSLEHNLVPPIKREIRGGGRKAYWEMSECKGASGMKYGVKKSPFDRTGPGVADPFFTEDGTRPDPENMAKLLSGAIDVPSTASHSFRDLLEQFHFGGGTTFYEIKNGNPALRGHSTMPHDTWLITCQGDLIILTKWPEDSIRMIKNKGEIVVATSPGKGEDRGIARLLGPRNHPVYTVSEKVFNIDKEGLPSAVEFDIHTLVLHTIKSNRKKGSRSADHIGRNTLDNRRRALMWSTDKEQSNNQGPSL